MSIYQKINTPEFSTYMASIGTMKPAKVDRENANKMKKLMAIYQDPNYVAEDKIDGCHYKMFGCRFASTSHVEKTHNFPHLRDFFDELGFANLLLDGEIHYPGKTSQDCTPVTGSGPETAVAFQKEHGYIHYKLFDILRTPKGTWLINKPLKVRRQLLEHFYNIYIVGSPMEQYISLTQWRFDKEEFRDGIWAEGGEGTVLKHLDSVYVMNKKPAWQWVKEKKADTTDLFIIGYLPPKKAYTGKNVENWPYWEETAAGMIPVTENYSKGLIGSIVLGAYDAKDRSKIIEVCSVSGFDQDLRRAISSNPDSFLNKVVVVDYMELTNTGNPRHPGFKEFHDGKRTIECIWPDRDTADYDFEDSDDELNDQEE